MKKRKFDSLSSERPLGQTLDCSVKSHLPRVKHQQLFDGGGGVGSTLLSFGVDLISLVDTSVSTNYLVYLDVTSIVMLQCCSQHFSNLFTPQETNKGWLDDLLITLLCNQFEKDLLNLLRHGWYPQAGQRLAIHVLREEVERLYLKISSDPSLLPLPAATFVLKPFLKALPHRKQLFSLVKQLVRCQVPHSQCGKRHVRVQCLCCLNFSCTRKAESGEQNLYYLSCAACKDCHVLTNGSFMTARALPPCFKFRANSRHCLVNSKPCLVCELPFCKFCTQIDGQKFSDFLICSSCLNTPAIDL